MLYQAVISAVKISTQESMGCVVVLASLCLAWISGPFLLTLRALGTQACRFSGRFILSFKTILNQHMFRIVHKYCFSMNEFVYVCFTSRQTLKNAPQQQQRNNTATLHPDSISHSSIRLMVTPRSKCNNPPPHTHYADGLVLFYL